MEFKKIMVGAPAAYPTGQSFGITNRTGKHRDILDGSAVDWAFIEPTDARWRTFLESVPHDFYHLPEYLMLCGKYEGGQPLAFYANDVDSRCLIPLLLKSLPERFGAPPTWSDLSSPYGYPCPLYKGPKNATKVSRFRDALRTAAGELGIPSVFLRLHPLFDDCQECAEGMSACVSHGQTVCIDLTHSEEEMWRGIRDGHRSDIRRLEKLNFIAVMDDWNLYTEFMRVYRSTMSRLGAGDFYYFSDDYFAELKCALGDALHLCCVIAPDGPVAAGGLVTAVGKIMQYHLSGTNPEYHRLAPTKLMLDFARRWGKQHGCSVFHLGGGAGAQDGSLFRFKAGFSPDRKLFRTFRLIGNESRYATLSLTADRNFDPLADLQSAFFPPYRKLMD
jgi:hypothetical protein